MAIDLVVMVIVHAHPATVLSVVSAHLSVTASVQRVMVTDLVATATVLSPVTRAIGRVATATARTVTQPRESTVSQELTPLQW
jgi:hypothetical protein